MKGCRGRGVSRGGGVRGGESVGAESEGYDAEGVESELENHRGPSQRGGMGPETTRGLLYIIATVFMHL
jgi:hypothetical protein